MKTEKAQLKSALRRCLKYTQLYSVKECPMLKISSWWNYWLYRVDLSNKMNAEYKRVITVCKAYFVFFFYVFIYHIPHPIVTLTKFWIYGIHYILFFLPWHNNLSGPRSPHCWGFMITLRHTTLSRNIHTYRMHINSRCIIVCTTLGVHHLLLMWVYKFSHNTVLRTGVSATLFYEISLHNVHLYWHKNNTELISTSPHPQTMFALTIAGTNLMHWWVTRLLNCIPLCLSVTPPSNAVTNTTW